MAHRVIEATSAEQLAEYKKTAEYSQYIAGAKKVSDGVNPYDPKSNVNADEKVDIHWVLIENDKDEDNETLRINDEGVAEFWASGVEI